MGCVIVTGATGFIGRALVKELSVDYSVIAIIRDINKIDYELKNVEYVVCDLLDMNRLPEKIKGMKIDAFYHIAWQGTSGIERGDYEIQLQNIKATCDAINVADELGCHKFVYAGSLMEYESIKYMSLSGSMPELNYIYRTAKLASHYMAKALAVSKNIDFNCAIISNVYGVGERSKRLINSTIRKLLNGEKTAFTDASQLYDFIYIDDAVRALKAIGEQGKPYAIYYVGNEKPQPLKEFLLKIRNCIDVNIDLGIGKMQLNGIGLEYNEFDTSLLYKDTDFKCKVSFDEGIKKTVKWIRETDTCRR